mgnify:CR=1 FL=1
MVRMEERISFKVLIIPQERRERRAGRSNYLSGAERFEIKSLAQTLFELLLDRTI